MRLLSLTIASNNDRSNKRALTYYMIVGDGDSDRPLTNNPKHRISITDGGVTNIVEEKELKLEFSKKYCEGLSSLLEGEIAIRFLAPLLARTNSVETVVLPQAHPAPTMPNLPSLLAGSRTLPQLSLDAHSGDLPVRQLSLSLTLPSIQTPHQTHEAQGEEDYSYLNGLTDADVELALRRTNSAHSQPPTRVDAVIASLFSTPQPALSSNPSVVLGAVTSTQQPVSQEDEVIVIDEESQLPNDRKRAREGK